MLDLPFYKNTTNGNQCLQISMKIVLKYFLEKEYSLEELDSLTGREKDLWTWNVQIVSVLHDLGLKVKFYSSEDIKPLIEGEEYIRRHYGVHADKILEKSDINTIIKATKNLMSYNLFEKRKIPFKEVENHIEQGHVPIMLIDYNVLSEKEGLYQGHSVVVTGVDKESVYYHESGPGPDMQPNRKVLKEKFIKAWNAQGTDNDIIIVFGKR